MPFRLPGFRRRHDDEAIDAELQLHVELETEDLVRRGVPKEEAVRRARIAFGGLTQVHENVREMRRGAFLEGCGRDFRFGLSALRRQPGFSVAVVLVLAVGLGATLAIFALVNTVVLQPLPYPEPDRLVTIRHAVPGLGLTGAGVSNGLFREYDARATSFELAGAYYEGNSNLRLADGTLARVHLAYAGRRVFEVLGVKPVLGRLFTEEDGAPGFRNLTWPVPVLLAYHLWSGQLAGNRNIVGQTITLNGRERRVLGVMPPGFVFPNAETQVWMMFEVPPGANGFGASFDLDVIARLRPEISARTAETQLTRIVADMVGRYPDATPQRAAELRLAPLVIPLKTVVIGHTGRALWTVFGGVLCLFAIAIANAGGLVAIRAERRQSEIAVRRAIGASASQIARLFVIEGLVLIAPAAALGLAVSHTLLELVVAWSATPLPRANEIGMDAWSGAFAVTTSLLLAAGYGMLSLTPMREAPASDALRSGARLSDLRQGRWMRYPLVATQVALALMLAIGSVLMFQTYVNLATRDLGFAPDRLLTARVSLISSRYRDVARVYDELIRRVQQLPGVTQAAAASALPLAPYDHDQQFPVESSGRPVLVKFFTPGYFQTMKTAILEGATFADAAPVGLSRPVLLSAQLAHRLFGHERVIGQPLSRLDDDGRPMTMPGPVGADGMRREMQVPPFTVAGVVSDVRETAVRDEPTDVVYIPVLDPPVEQALVPVNLTLAVRTDVPPLSVAAALRETVSAVDSGLSVSDIRTMEAIVQSSRATETFVSKLLFVAASVSLFLGLVGIYASVAHEVSRRRREIAIRLSLGARPSGVVRLMHRQAMLPVLVGAFCGLVAALAATETLRSMLFGVQPTDSSTFIVVTAGLVTAAATAALIAARRAADIPPTVALRGD